jgi:hypothetical protein
MTLDLTERQARLLLPVIREELRHEGGFIDSDDAKALGVLIDVIDEQLRKGGPPMWTREYKGLYIHGFCVGDQSWTTVSWGSGEPVLPGYKFKSLRAAQMFITKIKGMS